MAKSKNPFVGYTIREVEEAESCSFIIQIGNSVFSRNGEYVFSKSQAERYYNKLLNSILNTLKDGNETQKHSAKKCLEKLKIMPLRIQ